MYLAVGGVNQVLILDASDGSNYACVARLTAETSDFDNVVCSVAFSPVGALLACGMGAYGVVKLWDNLEDNSVYCEELKGPCVKDDEVNRVLFNCDGSRLLAINTVNSIAAVWDMNDRRFLFKAEIGYQSPAQFTADGNTIVAFVGELLMCQVLFIDATTGAQSLLDIGNRLQSFVQLSPNGDLVARACCNYEIEILGLSRDSIQSLRWLTGPVGNLARVDFGADGNKLVTSSNSGTLRLWRLDIDSCLHCFQYNGLSGSVEAVVIHPVVDQLVELRSSRDGATLTVYDVNSDSRVPIQLPNEFGFMHSIGFSAAPTILM
jgi:WD40 repeat protein